MNMKMKMKIKVATKSFCTINKLGNLLGIEEVKASESIREEFNKYSFESTVLPIINKHKRVFPELNKFLLQTAFNKEKKIFLPSHSDLYLERFEEIKVYLKEKIQIDNASLAEVIYCVPQLALEYTNVTKRNIDFVLDFFKITSDPLTHKTLIDYPKILLATKERYYEWTSYLIIYLKNNNLSQEFLDDMTRKNPLIITADPDNVYRYGNNLIELEENIRALCKKNIESIKNKKLLLEKAKELVSKVKEENPFSSIPEYTTHHKLSNGSLEEKYKDFTGFELIELNPMLLLTSAEKMKMIFVSLKEKIGIDYPLTLDLIKACPDILFLNKNGLLEKKLDMLLKLNINRYTLKQLFKYFPFMLTRSFNSYIKKYEFIKEQGYKLDGEEDLYPMILLFDYSTEIKPKLTILKNIEKKILELKASENLATFSTLKKEVTGKLISVSWAFSLSKEEFCNEVGVDVVEYNTIVDKANKEKGSNKYDLDLEERDLVFSYTKFNYY